MRALIVTSMLPTAADPVRGRFVQDQLEALRALGAAQIELFAFPPGLASYPRAARALRARYRGRSFDVVHSHFGLTAWPAMAVRARTRIVTLHGTDLRHPRSRAITLAALRAGTLPATVSARLARALPARRRRRALVLPCGVDLERFRPLPRADARRRLGLDADGRYLLFPADPSRPVKRHDRARELAAALDARLLELGSVAPDAVPWWINAANAVVVPSEAEGFGLAALEALACEVPVAATPVGIHPLALRRVPGTHCGPYDRETWRAALAPHVEADDPRVAGRASAELFGAARMAARVGVAWSALSGADAPLDSPAAPA